MNAQRVHVSSSISVPNNR